MPDLSFPLWPYSSSISSTVLGGLSRQSILVATGDSITEGGNNGNSYAANVFSGSGTTGTITASTDFPVGGTIFIHGLAQSEWCGAKTIATNDGNTLTFTNATALTASPTLQSPFTSASVYCDQSNNCRNFLKVANGLLGMPFGYIYTRAMSGARTDYMLSRFSIDVLSLRPNVVWILGGINDITSDYPAANDDLTPFQNLSNMANQAIAAGAVVLFSTILPLTGSGGTGTSATATVARQNTILRLNQRIRQFAWNTPGCLLIDSHKVCSAPTTKNWAAGSSLYSADGTHPTSYAAYEIALQIQTTLLERFGAVAPLVDNATDSYDTDSTSRQIMFDPLLQNSTVSAITGFTGSYWTNTQPSQYVGTPTATIAMASRSDGFGNDQSITVTLAAANDQIRFYTPNTGLLATRMNGFVGKLAQFMFSFSQASVPVTTLQGLDFYLEMIAGGVTTRIWAMEASTGNMTNKNGAYIIYSEPFVIPASLTNATMNLIFRFAGVGTNSVFTYGRFSFVIVN